jgi:hypothetical protein
VEWAPLRHIPPFLAKLKYSIRLVTLQCISLHCEEFTESLAQAAKLFLPWVNGGNGESIFRWLRDQSIKISSVVFNNPTKAKFFPIGDNPDMFEYLGVHLRWSNFRMWMLATLCMTEKALIDMVVDVDLTAEELGKGPVRDNLSNTHAGMSFLTLPENYHLAHHSDLLLLKLLAHPKYRDPSSKPNRNAFLELSRKIETLTRRTMSSVHLLLGGLARGKETAQMTWENEDGQDRDLVFSGGRGVWVQKYKKTSTTSHIENIVTRGLSN